MCAPTFISVLLTIAKIWKQTKCSMTEEWIKKMWYQYIYAVQYYLDLKRKESCPMTLHG